MRALIVDDSRFVRLTMAKMLAQFGYDVLEAGHGQEALDTLERTPDVEVAIVDWNMPVMDGLELVERLRGDARRTKLQILMVTTESEIGRVQRALDAGVNEYLMKPFTLETLRDKLTMMGLDVV